MHNVEELQKLLKAGRKQWKAERIEKPFQLMEFNDQNSELIKQFVGSIKNHFILETFNIHLKKKVTLVTLEILVFPELKCHVWLSIGCS